MGKLLNIMSQNDSTALRNRASQIDTQLRISQETLINTLKNEISKVEIKIQDLTDFAPDTTQSLRPGGKSWNPEQWALEMQKAQVTLFVLMRNLKIANKTYEDYFVDADNEVMADSDLA